MSNATQTIRNITATTSVSLPGTPTIYNITSSGTANTETSQALTANTKQFTIRARTRADLKIAFTATESGTNFITIPKGTSYTVSGIDFTGTIYLQSPSTSIPVEILEWT